MHTLTGSPGPFFTPAFATSLWLATVDKLLTQLSHAVAVLYGFKISCGQIELVAVIVY
jgi:predicted lysophospholipase L1 biosynthesis ABC-type transport system permease subunit